MKRSTIILTGILVIALLVPSAFARKQYPVNWGDERDGESPPFISNDSRVVLPAFIDDYRAGYGDYIRIPVGEGISTPFWAPIPQHPVYRERFTPYDPDDGIFPKRADPTRMDDKRGRIPRMDDKRALPTRMDD